MALLYTPAASSDFNLPAFTLPGVDGREISSERLTQHARAVLVAFICNHCPYVRAIEARLIALAAEFAPEHVVTLAICSNDAAEFTEDATPALLARWREQAYGFPYAVDAAQTVAKSFGAVCTPDFFLFDAQKKLVYRGRLDDSWRDPARVQRRELAEAITGVLRGAPPITDARPAMGCSIKWRA